MDLVDTLGLLATVVSFVVWWPQAHRVWSARHEPGALAGLSMRTQGLLLVASVLWVAYAFATRSPWVGAPSLVNVPVAVGTMVVLARGRRAA